ncbi:MAG: hypothetical protein ACK55Z_31090, partial [bacterium]
APPEGHVARGRLHEEDEGLRHHHRQLRRQARRMHSDSRHKGDSRALRGRLSGGILVPQVQDVCGRCHCRSKFHGEAASPVQGVRSGG